VANDPPRQDIYIFRAACLAVLLAPLAAAACQSSTQTPPPGGVVTASIGPAGGQVATQGAVLNVPSGALSSPTMITITEDPSGPPAPYVPLSPLFRFSPEGLMFAKPASVSFSTSSSSPKGHVYWSLASGPGYEALPTTWTGAIATASVEHFSSGFAGALPDDAAADAMGGDDAPAQDGTLSDEGTLEAMSSADGGGSSDASLPGADGSGPEDGALPDAGTTYVFGIVSGATAGATDTVTVSADESSSEPDADGGCTTLAATGHQQVTFPASALPYFFRFYFAEGPATGCTGRAYKISVTESDSRGILTASGSSSCAAVSGASVGCDVTDVLAPSDAGTPMPEAGADAGFDAGDLLASTIQFAGTVTGTMPPGASFLKVELMASTDPLGVMNSMPFCSPTIPNFQLAADTFLPPTLPATYSFTFGPNPNICGAAFEIEAVPTNANLVLLPGSSASVVSCGRIGTGNTGGGPNLQSTTVTCNVALP
jgi:hypothetical protein